MLTKSSPIHINLRERSYDIHIGWNLLKNTYHFIPDSLKKKRAIIVSDTTVFSLYGKTITDNLKSAGLSLGKPYVLQPGEKSKSIKELTSCWNHFVNQSLNRSSFVIALGGGVTGDLTGFAASTFMRGIPFIQIPTTLLAQADAAVGGKTAINLPAGKNLVGTFHQPETVIIDLCLLKTLHAAQIRNGLGEIFKMALLDGKDFFDQLIHSKNVIHDPESETLAKAIARCCRLKSDIISKDEKEETGLRAILNYGHTLGHALEYSYNFDQIQHGEAVVLGILAANEISHRLGLLSEHDKETISIAAQDLNLLKKLQPVADIDILRALKIDKKNSDQGVSFVLLKSFGKTIIKSALCDELILDSLASVLQAGFDHIDFE